MFTRSAPHWSKTLKADEEFIRLIAEKNMKLYPRLADPVRDSPTYITCTFGGKTIPLTLNKIDKHALYAYGWSYCTLLALALNELTNLPLTLITRGRAGKLGHAVVKVSENNYLDIAGLTTMDKLHATYGTDYAEELPRGEFCARVATDEHVDNPFTFVGEVEKRVTYHFAQLVINQYL